MNAALLKDLAASVGEKWVLTRASDRQAYAFDAGLERGLPSAVVLPSTSEQVARVVKLLYKAKIPFVARGAATSLCGGPVPGQGAVVISLTRMNKMSKLDEVTKEITVEPGVVNLRLQNAVAPQNLFFPPDPGSQKACTIGGNVSTNAGGPHCLKYGVTSQYVAGLDVVLPDGQFLQMRSDDPGPDLTGFFVGSEGTLGIVTRIRARLVPKPKFVKTALASFPSIEDAIQSVTDIIAAGVLPATLEAMDRTTVEAVEAFAHAGYPTDAEAVLLIEVDGDEEAELDAQIEAIRGVCSNNKNGEFRFAKDERERMKLWEGRRGSYPAMARLAPNVLVEDGAVPRTKLPEALKAVKAIAAEAGLKVALLFHAGDGNLHPQILFDERDAAVTRKVKEAGHKMLKACVDLGGTISGEHGVGVDKREAMRWLFTRETLSFFRKLKAVFDPENLCNPDKLIPLVSKAPETASQGEKAIESFGVPTNETDLQALVRHYSATRNVFGVQGTGTKFRVKDSNIIDMTKINKLVDLDVGNLTVTVQAGALIDRLRQEVEKNGKYLWVGGDGTVGGVIATRASAVPALRDQILAMTVMLPTGDVVRLGAKTMKNVAGYDVPKLLVGSWGTLGIIVDVTFRLFPYPAKQIKSQPVQPFVFKDIHKRLKKAFDPHDLFGRRTAAMSADDIAAWLREPKGPVGLDDKQMKNLGDKFWM